MSTLTSTPGASTSNDHLSYPSHKADERPPTPPPLPRARELSKNRLYVGNLSHTINEYTFLQIFSKFGKVSKLDFLFHKSGPSKGKPRGYAFVEYQTPEEAAKALKAVNDKLLRGRKVSVTYANQAPSYDDHHAAYSAAGGGKHYRRSEPQRPTTLSLIKTTSGRTRTEDKIAAMEAKLRQMEKAKEPAPPSKLPPAHHSLPLKPPPTLSELSSGPTTLPSASTTTLNSHSSSSSFKTSTDNTRAAGFRTGSGPRLRANGNGPNDKTREPLGIFASGSSGSLGKKPTLEELMKVRQKTVTNIGLLKN